MCFLGCVGSSVFICRCRLFLCFVFYFYVYYLTSAKLPEIKKLDEFSHSTVNSARSNLGGISWQVRITPCLSQMM